MTEASSTAGRGADAPATSRDGADGPRQVVAIGGGHGLARSLVAMTTLDWRPTAIVSIADDGGSSGRLRQELHVTPPGDLRRALSSLCPEPRHAQLLEHRFRAGTLDGHAAGNLLLLAAAATDGAMTSGLALLGDLFDARGRVVPVSEHGVDLEATLVDGSVVRGQRRLTATSGIERLRVVPPDVTANPVALQAIAHADLVVLGPGSLFTSILAPLLLPGVADALASSAATTALIANIRQQPGETTGMDLQAHVDAFFAHLPTEVAIDVLLCNDGAVDPGALAGLDALAGPVAHPRVGRVVSAALSDAAGSHDPALLAAVLADL